MEPEFDQPKIFDKSRIPDQAAAAGAEIGSWGYGVQVYGVARGHKKKKETPSLLTDMCGFSSKEEMQDARQYLQTHGNYQIEQVSVKWLVTLYYFVSMYWSLCWLQGVVKWLVALLDFESFYQLPLWSHCTNSYSLSLQVDSSGNCLFGALKRSLTVHNNSGFDVFVWGWREWTHQETGIHPCPSNNIWDACWRSPSGGMKLFYMQCHACGGSRSPSWTWRLSKSIGYGMTGQWIMLTQSSTFSNNHFNAAGK